MSENIRGGLLGQGGFSTCEVLATEVAARLAKSACRWVHAGEYTPVYTGAD